MANNHNSLLDIIFVSAEVEGFVKTGGLADVAKALPLALKRMGHRVRVVMPFYRSISNRESAKEIARTHVTAAGQKIEFRIMEMFMQEVQVLMIDCPKYYDRPELYAENNQAYTDNGERFGFFSLAALQACVHFGMSPDIIHCQDWHTGALPVLLRTRFANEPLLSNSKTVITIHNAAFQGNYRIDELALLPELANLPDRRAYCSHDCISLLRAAILYSDKINAVSPTYANELKAEPGAHGVSEVINARQADFTGILNGCDYDDWDPATDPHIPFNFSLSDQSGKVKCREALQKALNLEVGDKPVFGMVSRITGQKGFDYLLPALRGMLVHDAQVALVGTGDPLITAELRLLADQNPHKFAFFNGYSNEMAHLVEAGSDFFLMPSLFEPCGLNQMYSLAYGTLPIVRAVGGLKDTVVDFDKDRENATGFVFYEASGEQMLSTLRRVLLAGHEDRDDMNHARNNAMATRFEWEASAEVYAGLYYDAIK